MQISEGLHGNVLQQDMGKDKHESLFFLSQLMSFGMDPDRDQHICCPVTVKKNAHKPVKPSSYLLNWLMMLTVLQ